MKKNAFTLIELLAVIVIISLITLITTINVFKYINSSKNEISETDKSSIISASKNWTADHLDLLPRVDSGEQYTLEISELIKGGYLPEQSEKYSKFHVVIKYKDTQYIYTIES